MSYLVLARKWRPQTFDMVVGQPHVTKTLQNAILSNRIAHAYLFTGARGVGKTSVARILAKALNCERGTSPTPCDQCSNCREIRQGSSVDVLEIDGASNRGIDNIRELRETVRYRPAKSAFKVYIIDEVHMLTNEAFNALLKTLEEPPDHVLFVFATTEPHKIPATILSRCQRFDFRRIPTGRILQHLKNIASEEKSPLSETLLYAIAHEADGSMRDAQSLLEQVLVFSGDGLSDAEMLDILGMVDRESIHKVGRAILENDVLTCLEAVKNLYERGIDSKRFCQQLCDYFRSLLLLSMGKDLEASWLDVPEEEWNALKEEAARTTPESLYLCFQLILKGEEGVRRSSLPRIALEMLLVRLTQLPRLESLEELLEKVTALEDRLTGSAPFPVPRRPVERSSSAPVYPKESGKSEEAPESPFPKDSLSQPEPIPLSVSSTAERDSEAASRPPVGDVVEAWPRFHRWLEDKDPILAAKLAGSGVKKVAENTLEVDVLAIYEESFSGSESQSKLTDLARDFFGQTFRWSIQKRAPLPPETKNSGDFDSSKPNLNRLVLSHPVVQQAQEILGGELTEIRILSSKRAHREKNKISE